MPNPAQVRWDADLQRWAAPPVPEHPPDESAQAALPTVVVLVLVVLLLAVAVGVHTDTSETDTEESAGAYGDEGYGDEEPYREDSTDEGPAEDEGDHGLFPDDPPEDEAPEPDGYSFREDSAGFGLYVPRGWERQDDGPPQGVFYTGDGRRNLIQVMDFAGGHDSPQQAMDALVAGVEDNPGYSDYGQRELDGGAVELNYVYDHAEYGPRDVYVRTFLGQDREVHAVLAAGPEEDWALTEERYETAADSFCLSDHPCRR